jgi:hypothetical protein
MSSDKKPKAKNNTVHVELDGLTVEIDDRGNVIVPEVTLSRLAERAIEALNRHFPDENVTFEEWAEHRSENIEDYVAGNSTPRVNAETEGKNR